MTTPQPLAQLRNRAHLAFERVWTVEDHQANNRPGMHDENLFVMLNGLWILLSRDDIGAGEMLHASASFSSDGDAFLSATLTADPIGNLMATMRCSIAVILGVPETELEFMGLLGDKKIPNWGMPWPVPDGLGRDIDLCSHEIEKQRERLPEALAHTIGERAPGRHSEFLFADGLRLMVTKELKGDLLVHVCANWVPGSIAGELADEHERPMAWLLERLVERSRRLLGVERDHVEVLGISKAGIAHLTVDWTKWSKKANQ